MYPIIPLDTYKLNKHKPLNNSSKLDTAIIIASFASLILFGSISINYYLIGAGIAIIGGTFCSVHQVVHAVNNANKRRKTFQLKLRNN